MVLFTLTRWGDTNNGGNTLTVGNFNYAGSASASEYVQSQPITFNPGDVVLTNSTISPLVDTTSYVGNKTIIVGMAAGTGFTLATSNTVTFTIIDNANLPATVLWANPLTDPNDVTNWGVTSANNDMQNVGIDDTIAFGYDLTTNNPDNVAGGLNGLTLPPPPNGATNCLRVTVNKNTGRAAGVNLYPTNVTFSGDYAVRFYMNIAEGNSAAYTTEGPLFGINHVGIYTNWWTGSGILSGWDPSNTSSNWSSDGVWYWISADGGATAGDYLEKTGLGGTNGNTGWNNLAAGLRGTYANNFKDPAPYSTLNGTTPAAGLPANSSPFNGYAQGNGYTNAWADVEIKTVKNLVTLSINKTTIFTYNNTNTVWTNGTIMLGYNDPFSSVGGSDAAVYFSAINVVRLAPPLITLQPTNIIAAAGSTTNFTVAANFDSSSVNTNGQWLLNGVAIAGATNATYSFTVGSASYGTYSWTVNDGNYSVTSSNATLRPPAFTITSQPQASMVVAAGVATNVSVTAPTFSGATNYQWQFNSVNRTGATSRTNSFTSGPTNYGSFRVIVNDNWNYVTSSVAVVTPPQPNIITPPPSLAAVIGGSPSFKVVAQTFSGLTNYQWYSNTVVMAGATVNPLTLANVQPGSFGVNYTVSVNDGTTLVTSTPPATLTLATQPTIAGPTVAGSKFQFSFGSQLGPNYVEDSKTNLLQTNWVPVITNAGNGGTINVTNSTTNSPTGFFRIRLQ